MENCLKEKFKIGDNKIIEFRENSLEEITEKEAKEKGFKEVARFKGVNLLKRNGI